MQHPGDLSIQDFTYSLPSEKIASYPLPERDASKLLVYDKGYITTDIYKRIAVHIPKNSMLVFNDTKVVEARILFKKESGGVVEIFCLEPHEMYADITTAMSQKGGVKWLCLVGGASKWKKKTCLQLNLNGENGFCLTASMLEQRRDSFVIQFDWDDPALSFAEVLHNAGQVPLPPYIKRKPEADDNKRYQTLYAHYDGSVAAPTAGLHFTEHILKDLKEKNIKTDFVTLHVGAGTFKPVKSEKMEDHEMHAEFIDVEIEFIENLIKHLPDPVVAVGTTSLRTIESLYWIGCKLLQSTNNFNEESIFLHQWEAYEMMNVGYSIEAALKKIVQYLKWQNKNRLLAKTQIIIAPGYQFKLVDGLVTNFHQPSSTLLLLVAAFIGNDWHKVYDYALANEYRFLSYGDGSILWRSRKD